MSVATLRKYRRRRLTKKKKGDPREIITLSVNNILTSANRMKIWHVFLRNTNSVYIIWIFSRTICFHNGDDTSSRTTSIQLRFSLKIVFNRSRAYNDVYGKSEYTWIFWKRSVLYGLGKGLCSRHVSQPIVKKCPPTDDDKTSSVSLYYVVLPPTHQPPRFCDNMRTSRTARHIKLYNTVYNSTDSDSGWQIHRCNLTRNIKTIRIRRD